MDLHLKQWRDHQQIESEVDEHQSDAKIPRLFFETNHYHHHGDHNNNEEKFDEPALPLFVPEPASSNKINSSANLSAPPPASAFSSDCSTRFPRLGGGYFSMAQWQELELQAVIFRHMMAGAAVPPELLQLIKKSLLNSPSYYFHQQNYPFYQPTLLQAAAGYWGRGSMDPEPGRCRRTDGKKWRCSRDVVSGQKYCERHVHRGRNRSRKPVEFPTNTNTAATNTTMNNSAISSAFGGSGGGGEANNGGGVGLGTAIKSTTTFASPSQLASTGGSGSQFSLSGPNVPFDILQLNQGSAELKPDKKGGCFDSQHEASGDHGTSSSRVLRHFFDDWPRGSNHGGNSTGPGDSATCLSISTPGGSGGNSTSDFLKLSTGNGEEIGRRGGGDDGESGGGGQQRAQGQLNWNSVVGWGTNHHHQMGGPLAEALRSSAATNNYSPTSVLHQLQRCCTASADTNYVSA